MFGSSLQLADALGAVLGQRDASGAPLADEDDEDEEDANPGLASGGVVVSGGVAASGGAVIG
eukprot:1792291-Prymnesium_polylepis.1